MTEKKIINIRCALGLCNRIRYLFSWIHKIKNEDIKINMIWLVNKHCNGAFDSCFESIDDVNFIYSNTNIDHDCSQSAYSFIDKKYSPEHIDSFYEKLQPNSKIKNIIKHQQSIGDYNSVHIRRTDHSSLAKKNNIYTIDTEFENFIANSSLPVYLSTDNTETQKHYIKKYKNIFTYKKIKDTSSCLRQTSLEHAVIDIWMCIYSKEFMPSGYSSFSGLIKDQRRLNA